MTWFIILPFEFSYNERQVLPKILCHCIICGVGCMVGGGIGQDQDESDFMIAEFLQSAQACR